MSFDVKRPEVSQRAVKVIVTSISSLVRITASMANARSRNLQTPRPILKSNRPLLTVVFGNRIQGYRNSKRMVVNGMVKRLCKEDEVGYVDLWDSFVGEEEMYMRDGLHLSGKGAAVFAEGLSGAVASGLGKVRYLN